MSTGTHADPTSDRPETTAETLLEVRNLKKYYDDGTFVSDPVKAVDGVSFDLRKGETLGVVGESGCGKTTLGRTILGLEEATDGQVLSDGTDVTTISGVDQREWQRDAQMVFQDPDSSLNDRMTVGEIIREPLDAHDWKTAAKRRDRVFELIDEVGLREEHYYRYPHQFSGGQRQRIGIARALALEPEFIVLDEPVSALDVSVQARIINLLDRLQDELDLTYLFIAHDLSVVRHICDRVAVMYLGNVVELGPTESVYTDPSHPYTISLLSAIPGSAGPDRQRVTLRGTPPSPRDPPQGCRFVTRCPAKVRPDEYETLSEEAWAGIESLVTVFRARAQADEGLIERVKTLLGRSPRDDVDEIYEDLFGDVALPDQAQSEIDRALEASRSGDDEVATAVIREAFGSVCNEQRPEAHVVDEDGRFSKCVRHEEGYEDPESVIERRVSR
ncbi:ABC transporter ATP-binding protein [Halobaculum sp. MBLA0147]|uniref:ABC transporter ATP-binding protein n=1 Tax=Halobaculum sp. MBLA0147 TaxID=3079934 RepID=UPI00352547CF